MHACEEILCVNLSDFCKQRVLKGMPPHESHLRMAVVKKMGNDKWRQGCGQVELLSMAGRNVIGCIRSGK